MIREEKSTKKLKGSAVMVEAKKKVKNENNDFKHVVIDKGLYSLKGPHFVTLLALSTQMDKDKIIDLKAHDLAETLGWNDVATAYRRVLRLTEVLYKGEPLVKDLGRYRFQIMTNDIEIL